MSDRVANMGPAFNRMWASSIISNLSDGILIAAAPLLAISLTDSTVLISAIGAMVMLPWLLFAIPIGALVDRVDRRYDADDQHPQSHKDARLHEHVTRLFSKRNGRTASHFDADACTACLNA